MKHVWRCLNCGERIDDVFDACWKCGAAQDGTAAADFPAPPDDAAALDPRSQSDPADATAEESVAAPNDAKNARIVELCSAANEFEAQALCALLAEAGIQARVVGGLLGDAAGGLPLGEAVAPRIWVREEDAARVRQIIDKQADRSRREMG